MPLDASLKTHTFGIPFPFLPLPSTLSSFRFYSSSQKSSPASPTTTAIPSKLSLRFAASSPSEPPSALPHLTATSTVHVIPISHKTPTARSAIAVGHVRFSSPAPLRLIRTHALVKGDVLAAARIAAITAAKKTSDWIPLCHSGVPIEGIEVRVVLVDGHRNAEEVQSPISPSVASSETFDQQNETSPAERAPAVVANTTITTKPPPTSKEPKKFHVHKPEDQDDQRDPLLLLASPLLPHGGVRISVRVDTTAKTGVEMEALVGVVGAGLTVVDMCKGVDRELVLEGVRVLGKRGGRSGSWGCLAREGEDEGGGGRECS